MADSSTCIFLVGQAENVFHKVTFCRLFLASKLRTTRFEDCLSEASSAETSLFVSDAASLELNVPLPWNHFLHGRLFYKYFSCRAGGKCFPQGNLLPFVLSEQVANNSFRGLFERSEFRRNEFVCERRGELRTKRAVTVESFSARPEIFTF